jgi:hypothetical protein
MSRGGFAKNGADFSSRYAKWGAYLAVEKHEIFVWQERRWKRPRSKLWC